MWLLRAVNIFQNATESSQCVLYFPSCSQYIYILGQWALSTCFPLCWTGLNWFIGRLTWMVHSNFAWTSQEGIKCTKAEGQLGAYCPYIYTFPLVAIYVKNLREVTPGYPRVYIRFVLVQPNKSNNPDLNRPTFFTLSANLTWLRFFLNPEGLANPTWSINWFHFGLIKTSLGWTPILIHRTNWYWTKKSSQPDQVILKIGSNNASLFSSINFLVKTVFLTWNKMQIILLNPVLDTLQIYW